MSDYKVSTAVNMELSAKVRDALGHEDHACYRTAFLTLSLGLLPNGSVYCEGLAASTYACGVPLEHGWCELPDGSVVDAQWLHDEAAYLALHRFTLADLQARLRQKGQVMLPLRPRLFEGVVSTADEVTGLYRLLLEAVEKLP